ncbi:MAG: hypothetical protein CEN88_276 [Candidatus Berkelbacteria bacterium Licking1014_2]|uniref:Transposase IS200-like domain-containing protein n=1 Tax=Candidatus Berkelbacteria bacterium Licking1014_2 TaxID=2017146 RepID=A0A554LV72_9BACT|nr:MAG: hypothetical protein CEN88_276 [Candidatus Berkelbacteria bacterium Licking1014_2]
MPNHIHLLVWQKTSLPVYKFIHSLHTSYSMVFNLRHKRIGGLFQDAFKQKIVDNDEYVAQVLKYIHTNPLNHRFPMSGRSGKKEILIKTKEQLLEIPFSSAREYATNNFNIVSRDLVNKILPDPLRAIDFSTLFVEDYVAPYLIETAGNGNHRHNTGKQGSD